MQVCNYDASFINADTDPQAGWIFRDSTAFFLIAGQAKGYKVLNTVLESELQGLLQARKSK